MQLPINDHLTLYPLGGASVVFSRQSGRLYGFDRHATEALQRLARHGPSAEAEIREDRNGTVRALMRLLAGEEPPKEPYPDELPCPLAKPGNATEATGYRLLNTHFALQCPESLWEKGILPYIAHLATPGKAPVDLHISISGENGGPWQLRLNDTPQGDALPTPRLVPVLHDRLRKFSYQCHPYLLTIHGTVVTNGRHTLILAGRSGSGKSTLAAALLARGFSLLSDEPAVLDLDGRVVSMPLGLALKEGSWPVVATDYPDLAGLPCHRRFDGTPLRFLLPGSVRMAPKEDVQRATHLIFPQFTPDAPGRACTLGMVEALGAVVGAGYQVPGLDEARVGRMIEWLKPLSRVAMTYSSTAEALTLLAGILEDARA